MVRWRVIPQHSFISVSCWDALARSSPLVYWLHTIRDCRGLWLLSLQKEGMQSIHERHRTFIFSLKKCIFISASISGDWDLKELFEKNLSLNVPRRHPFQIGTLIQTNMNLALTLWGWNKGLHKTLSSHPQLETKLIGKFILIAVCQTHTLWNDWRLGLAMPTGW